MKFTFTTKKVELSDSVKEYAEKKIGKGIIQVTNLAPLHRNTLYPKVHFLNNFLYFYKKSKQKVLHYLEKSIFQHYNINDDL